MQAKYVWGIAGLIFGGAIGAFSAYTYLDKKYAKMYTEEVLSLREKYREEKKKEEIGEEDRKDDEDKGAYIHQIMVDRPVTEEEIESIAEEQKALIRSMVDYSGVAQEDRENYVRQVMIEKGCPMTDEEIDSIFAEAEHPEDDDPEPQENPYVISAEDFFESCVGPGWDCDSVTYYEEDETFTDSTDELITDVRDIAGGEVITWFKEHPDELVCYVRNDKLRIDYEITRTLGHWLAEVMGDMYEPEPDEDAPTREKIMKRKPKEKEE